MQYDLIIGDTEESVDASPLDEQSNTTVNHNGTSRAVRLTALPPHRLQLREAGRGEDLFVARGSEGLWVWSKGCARLVSDAANRKLARRGGTDDTAQDVTPPMPAVVLSLLVEVGTVVDQGDRLIVVSAMKMETTLVAPHPGTVTAVNTEEGAKVAPGDILVEIAPEDTEGVEDDKTQAQQEKPG